MVGSSISPFGLWGRGDVGYFAKMVYANLMFVLHGRDETGGGTYEVSLDRAKRILQNSLKSLKQAGGDPKIRDILVREYERIEEEISKAEKSEAFVEKFNRWRYVFMSFISLPGIYNMLARGRFDKNYQKLLNALEDIGNSKLYYRASKLEQIARK